MTPSPLPISVVILTKNEAAKIGHCITALVADFSEVIVLDSDSTDGTPELARQCGANVINFRWNGRHPRKKQWALDHLDLKHDWVLLLDADEYMTPALVAALRNSFQGHRTPPHHGYFITACNRFGGKTLRHSLKNRKLALLKRGHARFPALDDLETPLGEVEGHVQPLIDGTIGHLRPAMIHDTAACLSDWLERHRRYAEWEAALRSRTRHRDISRSESGRRRLFKTLFNRLPARPLVAFVHSYVLCCGFLDGRAGLDFAVARAFYYWQVDALTREKINATRRRDNAQPHKLSANSAAPIGSLFEAD